MVLFFFFFKQKTAYDMRISDWSSDVCSSDLHRQGHRRHDGDRELAIDDAGRPAEKSHRQEHRRQHQRDRDQRDLQFLHRLDRRSEEHTSELQSLMRISYAVFCLKTKKKKTTH